MISRLGFVVLLVGLYLGGQELAAVNAPAGLKAALMAVLFLALAAAMYLRLLPALLALPVLALGLAALAGMNWQAILDTVVAQGGMRLSSAIFAVILGAMLAQIVEKTGIAETAVKTAAELGGDNPMVLTVVLFVVVAALFTTLGGLGSIIMVATIVLPILLSLGLRPLYVGCVLLLATSLGGIFNPANWAMFQDTLKLKTEAIVGYAVPFGVLTLVVALAFLVIEGRRMGKAAYKAEVEAPPRASVPWFALLTPIVPLLPLLYFALAPHFGAPAYDFPIPAAMLLGILFGAIATYRKGQSTVQLLVKSAFDGVSSVGPALVILLGIGMVVMATMSHEVSGIIAPQLTALVNLGGIPHVIWYLLLFAVLAPLALYRGPLNLYGMGAGLLAAFAGVFPPVAVMAAFQATGQVQGVSDPTNTQNVWVANYTKTDVQDILRCTLPYMWGLAVAGLVLASVLYFH